MISRQTPPAVRAAEAVDYGALATAVAAMIAGESDGVANLANFAALIYHTLPELNWAGFYLLQGKELVLGPFQGKAACVRIALGRGVCGTAARHGAALCVPDVHAFEGHIACDPASRAELVVPLRVRGRLRGVFDLDSARANRFTPADQHGIGRLLEVLMQGTYLPPRIPRRTAAR